MSFRQFLELADEKPVDHLTALADELGIDADMLTKVPQVMGNFSLGGFAYNLGGYRVLDILRDSEGKPSMVRVQLINDPAHKTRKRFKQHGGKWVSMKDEPDNKVYTIPVANLNKMMTQGMDQGGGAMAGGMGAMGGAGGLPGMGM